jgi:hypothetical protein
MKLSQARQIQQNLSSTGIIPEPPRELNDAEMVYYKRLARQLTKAQRNSTAVLYVLSDISELEALCDGLREEIKKHGLTQTTRQGVRPTPHIKLLADLQGRIERAMSKIRLLPTETRSEMTRKRHVEQQGVGNSVDGGDAHWADRSPQAVQ